METNSKLLKASLALLVAPMLLAYSDDSSVSDGMDFEVAVGVSAYATSDAYHSNATATALHLGKYTAAIVNSSAFAMQEDSSKPLNYTFGGSLEARSKFSEDFGFILQFNFATGFNDAKSMKAVDVGVATGTTVADADWNLQDTTYATIKSKMVMAPAAYLGYGNLYFGAVYDMREFEVSGQVATLTSYLNKNLKSNQVLFSARGEQSYELDDLKLIFAVTASSNLGKTADSEMETYFADLVKYGFDTKFGATPGIDGGLIDAATTYPLPAVRPVVGSTHNNRTQISLSAAVSMNI
jgi:hypothetical protein